MASHPTKLLQGLRRRDAALPGQHPLRQLPSRLARALAQWWRESREEPLSDAALRDLGLARCELDSLRAEHEGRAERTRQRVTQHHQGLGY